MSDPYPGIHRDGLTGLSSFLTFKTASQGVRLFNIRSLIEHFSGFGLGAVFLSRVLPRRGSISIAPGKEERHNPGFDGDRLYKAHPEFHLKDCVVCAVIKKCLLINLRNGEVDTVISKRPMRFIDEIKFVLKWSLKICI